MRISSLLRITAVGLASFALIACGDDDGGAGGGTAALRVIHASPDAPNVDVLIDGGVVLTNVPYGAASSYLPAAAGTNNIQVRATGGTQAVIDVDVDLDRDVSYSVLAINTVANIEPLLVQDDREPPAAGQAKLRAIHAAAGAPTVDIYVTAPDAPLTMPTLSAVPFGAASDYLSIPAGTYQVRVTVTGTTDVAIDTGPITIPAGSVSTAIALDADDGGAPFSILLLNDLG